MEEKQESFDGFSQADDLDDISVKMSETAGLSDPEDEIPADRIRVKLTKESEPDPSYGRQEPFYENDRQSIYENDTRSFYGNSTQSVYENQSQPYGDNSRNYGGNPRGSPMGTEMQVSHTVARVRRMVRKLRIILHGRNRKNR